ncbi:hypothetical protein ACVWXP_007364 [Bradyrhizobium sp. USDA 4463]
MIHCIITSDGLAPGLSFQVARPDAIRDKRRWPADEQGRRSIRTPQE